MRFKKYNLDKKILIGKKIQKLCKDKKVKFIVNDDPWLAKKLDADGCHLGQKDMNIKDARKIIGNKIIGITCHNSIKLAQQAIKKKASYLAFGAFSKTKTKKVKFRASTKVLNKIKITSRIFMKSAHQSSKESESESESERRYYSRSRKRAESRRRTDPQP